MPTTVLYSSTLTLVPAWASSPDLMSASAACIVRLLCVRSHFRWITNLNPNSFA